MDVDAASGRGAQHSEAKKQELQKNNQCFYCEIPGHRTKDCRKKAADHRSFRSGHANNPGKGGPPIHNRVSNDTPPFSLEPESITDYLKDNMDNFNEDQKLSIANSLMPKDFYPAQN